MQKLYEDYRGDQDRNVFIKGREGAVSFLNEVLNENNLMDTRKLWALPGEGKFIDMVHHFWPITIKAAKEQPDQYQSRKNLFCEVIIPIFKTLGSWLETWVAHGKRILKLYAEMMMAFSDFDMIGARSSLWSWDVYNCHWKISGFLESIKAF